MTFLSLCAMIHPAKREFGFGPRPITSGSPPSLPPSARSHSRLRVLRERSNKGYESATSAKIVLGCRTVYGRLEDNATPHPCPGPEHRQLFRRLRLFHCE